ncbi:peptidase [Pikeienuella piscinae]|uniref:Peptidase n=1 Tax=Pikeienuella piscinae TaxID=2748098 RepID=A0A7L5BU79_9RHOB|nr:NlpC/P60 family protein [Pikeienuella piscinae]QIE54503.1 peptidase [Pikeienuella piscinae]
MRVVTLAREWIGTPYRHQASLKGVGADCLGLIRGVWRELLGAEPEETPAYSRDWCEVSRDEALWRAAATWLAPGSSERLGNVLLFRMAPDAPAKHLAIRAGESPDAPTIIHAYSGRAVIESPFTGGWRRRVVAAFRYPEGS